MEPTEGPTKVCPECKNPVFESETVCGFCGHVFGVSIKARDTSPTSASGHWPKTYRYPRGGVKGLYFQMTIASMLVFGFPVAWTADTIVEGKSLALAIALDTGCLLFGGSILAFWILKIHKGDGDAVCRPHRVDDTFGRAHLGVEHGAIRQDLQKGRSLE